ncbi:hypothetical protein KKG41_04525 [Patescibacteria group bacterium]|nr:hypothetical protein [Patescibacteria group bacterium]MBU1889944.1 hypothetical protein [Patescibacteria group bacterium]
MFLAATAGIENSFIANIDWSQPTWDLFIILFFVIASFLYGISLGRDRILVILVSIYMALAVVNTAPYIGDMSTTEVGVNQFFVVRISLFLGVFILLFFLLSRSALLQTIASNSEKRGNFWQIMIFSILHVGLLISITLSFLPDTSSESLSPLTQTIFTSELGRFLWIVVPIILMIMFKGSNDKKFKYDV